MIKTQESVTRFHRKHKFPNCIPLIANRRLSWLVMWIIYRSTLSLSKSALRYWKATGTKNESFYRAHLMLEELAELMKYVNDGNLIGAADGLGDLLYVVIGTAVAYWLPAHEIIKEVCRSNDTKQVRTKSNIRLRDKGKDWQPPNFEKAIYEGRKRLRDLLLKSK